MTSNTLQRICDRRKKDVQQSQKDVSIEQLKSGGDFKNPTRGFVKSIRDRMADNQPALITEIKKASPSRGVIRENFDPVDHAIKLENSGAACLSVLTEPVDFMGSDSYMQNARAACALPVLRKDFIVDEWQIYETELI